MVKKRTRVVQNDDYEKFTIPLDHLPATIVGAKPVNRAFGAGTDLVEYEYQVKVDTGIDGDSFVQTRREGIRSKSDGTVKTVHVQPGQVISEAEKIVMEFEPCSHDVVFEGMCSSCSMDVFQGPQTTAATKTHVNMTHDAVSLVVSRKEASRLEADTASRLESTGKLSLILDLDQTLIHATVGSSIDDWINAQGTMPADIRMFPLSDSATPYYIKLRPHLEKFLRDISKIYELHIYTMGTRNYAEAVANAIDPEGIYFGHRILSRDENASMTQKSIERIFPCDSSMVVVVDDRADVWQWSPNLVKVHPYEYFVGAGDINAGLLPKQDLMIKSGDVDTEADSVDLKPENESDATKEENPGEESDQTPITDVAKSEESKEESKEEAGAAASSQLSPSPTTRHSIRSKPKKLVTPVQNDDDEDLLHIAETLEKIHEIFFDTRQRIAEKRQRNIFDDEVADVKEIIRDLKKDVLRGCKILFSSVIPLGTSPQDADIWKQARSFGAVCYSEVRPDLTHVVAAKVGTAKVTTARKTTRAKIVKPEWLYESITRWAKQNEDGFTLVDTPNKPSSPSTPPMDPIEEDDGGVSEGMDENHKPLSMDSEEVSEHLKSIVWDDLEKEVHDFVGDSDGTDFDSDASQSQSDAQSENEIPRGVKRARVIDVNRKSRLNEATTYDSSDEDEDDKSEKAPKFSINSRIFHPNNSKMALDDDDSDLNGDDDEDDEAEHDSNESALDGTDEEGTDSDDGDEESGDSENDDESKPSRSKKQKVKHTGADDDDDDEGEESSNSRIGAQNVSRRVEGMEAEESMTVEHHADGDDDDDDDDDEEIDDFLLEEME